MKPPRWVLRIASVIQRIVTALGLMFTFFVVLTPIAICLRWFGRDALGKNENAEWVPMDTSLRDHELEKMH